MPPRPRAIPTTAASRFPRASARLWRSTASARPGISRWRRTATSTSRSWAPARKGGVVALRDTDGDGQFEMKEHFGAGSSTGIALRNGYLYVAHHDQRRALQDDARAAEADGRAGDHRRRLAARSASTRTRASRSTARDRFTSTSARLRTPASSRTGRRSRRARIRARFSKSTAASGNSTKTSSARSRKTARASPPVCARCPPSRGTTARSTS